MTLRAVQPCTAVRHVLLSSDVQHRLHHWLQQQPKKVEPNMPNSTHSRSMQRTVQTINECCADEERPVTYSWLH